MKNFICTAFGLALLLCCISVPVGCQYVQKQGPEWMQDLREGSNNYQPMPRGVWFTSLLLMIGLGFAGGCAINEAGREAQ